MSTTLSQFSPVTIQRDNEQLVSATLDQFSPAAKLWSSTGSSIGGSSECFVLKEAFQSACQGGRGVAIPHVGGGESDHSQSLSSHTVNHSFSTLRSFTKTAISVFSADTMDSLRFVSIANLENAATLTCSTSENLPVVLNINFLLKYLPTDSFYNTIWPSISQLTSLRI